MAGMDQVKAAVSEHGNHVHRIFFSKVIQYSSPFPHQHPGDWRLTNVTYHRYTLTTPHHMARSLEHEGYFPSGTTLEGAVLYWMAVHLTLFDGVHKGKAMYW